MANLSPRTDHQAAQSVGIPLNTIWLLVWTVAGIVALVTGVIWGNTFNKFDPSAPFGGFKESGFGREGGRQGLAAYVEVS